jgi:hypothetical protein
MKDIPEGLKRGMIIGVSILFLVSLSVFFYLPKIKEIRRIKAEIAQAEKEIERIKRMERDFKPSSQEEARWREVEFSFPSLIPPEKDVHELIYELAGRAKRCDILDISLKEEKESKVPEGRQPVSPGTSVKGEPTPLGGMEYFFLRLYFHSEYRDLALFLKKIQGVKRFLLLESLVIKRGFPLISVELVVKAYYGRK